MTMRVVAADLGGRMHNTDGKAPDRIPAAGPARRTLRWGMAVACTVSLAACATAITGTASRGADPGPMASGSATAPAGTVTGSSNSVTDSSGTVTAVPPADPSDPITQPTDTPTTPPGVLTSTPTLSPFPSLTITTPPAATSWPVSSDTVATDSIATVDEHGVITVRTPGGGDRLVIDEYEEPICPPCGQFQSEYGEQIQRAIQDGKLTVRYHVAAFLDDHSASGDYSTRALAAMLALAKTAGDQPGLFLTFHTMLFDSAVQPMEDGVGDLTNAQLAALARQAGAPESSARAIEEGSQLDLATEAAARTSRQIQKSIASHSVPAVMVDGKQVSTGDPEWLITLLQG